MKKESILSGRKSAAKLLLAASSVCALLLTLPPTPARAAGNADFNLAGNMELGSIAGNRWGGVDATDNLKTFVARSQIVTTFGKVTDTEFSNSPAIGDLNGDGLPDIVVADPRGWVWYYKNSGTKTDPKFTRGELIPIFFFSQIGDHFYPPCLKLCLYDVNGDGKLDIVVGDFYGHIYLSLNQGGSATPVFKLAQELTDVQMIPSDLRGRPWGNFLAPAMYDWNGDGTVDMIVGEGTYSANNLYLYMNGGSNQTPRYPENKRSILIPGMGREHLTPTVYDWNGDGKPDLLVGEREGAVNLYINETQKPPEYKFREPIKIPIGSAQTVGTLSTFGVGDINGDGKNDLVFGRTTGRIGLSLNTGTNPEPKFGTIQELKGVSPFPKLMDPTKWHFAGPPWTSMTASFHTLRLVSANKAEPITYEEGFAVPDGSAGKYSLKMELTDGQQPTFPVPIRPPDPQYTIQCDVKVPVTPMKNQELSFWVKGAGFSGGKTRFWVYERRVRKGGDSESTTFQEEAYEIFNPFSISSSWTQVKQSIHFKKDDEDPNKEKPSTFTFEFQVEGQGTVYFDDVQLSEPK